MPTSHAALPVQRCDLQPHVPPAHLWRLRGGTDQTLLQLLQLHQPPSLSYSPFTSPKASLSPAPPPPCPRTRIFAPHSLVGAAYLSEHNTARNIIDAASSVRHPSDAHLLQPPSHLLLRIGPHAAHVSAHTRMLYMCPHTRTCLREEEAAAMREGHKSSPTCVFAHSKS